MNCSNTYRLRVIAGMVIALSLGLASPALAEHEREAPPVVAPQPHVHGYGDPGYGGPRPGQGANRSVECRVCHETIEEVWVPGRWEVRRQRVVCEPGHYEQTHIPARYETRYDECGRPYDVLVRPERYRKVWVPRRCEWRERKVWVPGYWKPVRTHVCRTVSRPQRPWWRFEIGSTRWRWDG